MVSRTLRAGVAVVLLALPASAQQPRTLQPSEIASQAKAALALVTAQAADGSVLRSGSGFFVDATGTLLTNYHVIEGRCRCR
jgi:S1-C subfamily serine protease